MGASISNRTFHNKIFLFYRNEQPTGRLVAPAFKPGLGNTNYFSADGKYRTRLFYYSKRLINLFQFDFKPK
ncbi:MAG TPA: hypothetical protein DCR40_12330 [Prolixibacteraceae bacterium]|nr:hypothetical protein [Prolixibacteraceae bacterium]